MNIIFQIEGGIGKSIMATAVIEGLSKKYPKDNIIVITSYPQVFLGNPYVYRTFAHGNTPYFYQNYIENKEIKCFLHNPYFETSFINKSEHLLETWFSLCGLKYCGEQPQLFLTKRELDFYSMPYIKQATKPIFVLQTNGGVEHQTVKYSWMRDIPLNVSQAVVNHFKETHTIYHIRRENQIPIEHTIPVHDDFRNLCALINISSKRLFMDSFAQHTAKALGLKSVVCWIGNTPQQFGYESNINILPNEETRKPELKFSTFNKYNISGEPVEFPYNDESEIFNAEKIIDALLEQ